MEVAPDFVAGRPMRVAMMEVRKRVSRWRMRRANRPGWRGEEAWTGYGAA